jgi:hypothetical protein
MYTGFGIFFLISSLLPGFFLLNFFRDAWNEYKASGKYFWETLLSSPGAFFTCLLVFLAMWAVGFFCLLLG